MNKWAMRIVGALNLALGIVGLWYFAVRLVSSWHKWLVVPSGTAWFVFFLLSAITVSMVSALVYLGVRLLVMDTSAIRKLIVLLAAEITYFIADVIVLWMVLPNPALSIGFFHLAEAPLDPQIITGYPVLALVIIWITRIRIASSGVVL